MRGSSIVQVNLKPSASSQECWLWNDHVYDCKQAQGLIAAKTPKEPKTPIDKWVSEVTNIDVQVDAFRPESTAERQESAGIGMVYNESLSSMKKPNTKRSRTARGNPNAFNKASTELEYPHDYKEAMMQENMTSSGNNQRTKILSTVKGSESFRQPPSIEPPYMPPHAVPLCSQSETPSGTSHHVLPTSTTWNVVIRGSSSGYLIDTSVPDEGCAKDEVAAVAANVLIQDNNTKAKTPGFKHTMNQKKAQTQAFLGGNTAFIRSLEDTTAHLLISALHYTGRVEITVDIGRLLIDQQYGSSEFKNRSFKTSEFSLVLPKGRTTGFEPIFTNKLTARSTEAESILDLLISQGRRLFHQHPISRKVTYVFSCKAKDGDQIIFEYNENGGCNVRSL